jgi:fatty-acyl-CoA synthase
MSLHLTIERWAREQPRKTALHFEGDDLSYATLAQQMVGLSEALAHKLGVVAGDRVAYLGYNRPEMLVLLYALSRIGAMLLPLNFRLASIELQEILEHAEPKALIVDHEFLAVAQELRSTPASLPTVVLGAAAGTFVAWSSLLTMPPKPLARLGQVHEPVLLVYTSGTTGRPKGAIHTQQGLIANAVAAADCHGLTRDDHVLTVLPMFHVGGLCIQTVPALYAGATVTLHRRFIAGRWLGDVAASRPTLSLLVPTTIKAILDHRDWEKADLSSLRAVYTGSSVIPGALFPPFHARGIPLAQVYGATETGPVSICLRFDDAVRKAGSAGRPALHVDIRLVGEDGRNVSSGQVGEIWVRAPNVMQGYWKEPPNTGFADGWFKTGDLARQDDEGFYWVVGRSKDMIISGGENIYPAEIESALAECDDIVEASVFGMPSERWGEVAVAVVVKKAESSLDEAGVLRLFEGRLARFKHPRRVVFLPSLPKTALGKVQKAELQRELSATGSSNQGWSD